MVGEKHEGAYAPLLPPRKDRLILVSGNWAHALDPVLPEDQMTQTETSILPNRCHLIKKK